MPLFNKRVSNSIAEHVKVRWWLSGLGLRTVIACWFFLLVFKCPELLLSFYYSDFPLPSCHSCMREISLLTQLFVFDHQQYRTKSAPGFHGLYIFIFVQSLSGNVSSFITYPLILPRHLTLRAKCPELLLSFYYSDFPLPSCHSCMREISLLTQLFVFDHQQYRTKSAPGFHGLYIFIFVQSLSGNVSSFITYPLILPRHLTLRACLDQYPNYPHCKHPFPGT